MTSHVPVCLLAHEEKGLISNTFCYAKREYSFSVRPVGCTPTFYMHVVRCSSILHAAPDVQWWTADEYEAWRNEQKKEMESLIGTGDGWYDGQGVFHEFTQESVDAMMDSYKETLESIKKGVLYSKDDGDGDTYSMIPPTEDVVSSYSVDVTKDNGKTVHIGDYSTVEELDKAISDAVKNGQLTQEEADSVQK